MTNDEIIKNEMERIGLNPLEVKIDTYSGWNKNKYRIKSGEKAAFCTWIWKPILKGSYIKMIKVKAAFFTDAQVEKI